MRVAKLSQLGLITLLAAALSPAANNQRSVAVTWDSAALQGIRDAKFGAPAVARALAIVHTCMYDAWAAYDDVALGTQLRDALRRPPKERTLANKEIAASYAAYYALADLIPQDKQMVYIPLMKQLGYDPALLSDNIDTPAGIGYVACAAVLEYRHHDGSNQLGDLAQGPYSDWTGYAAANPPSSVPSRSPVPNPDRWQPLSYFDEGGGLVRQQFAGAQWCEVLPFGMTSGDEFRSVVSPGPATFGSAEYARQAQELVDISAALSDQQKAIAEYWSDGPNSEQPPGHWALFAQFVSMRDHHTLDDDIKMFFVLSNALQDAGIAAWDTKRAFDSVRPVTAIAHLFKGKKIRAWAGPGKGTAYMDGSDWIPYQRPTIPTPPFPEYVSGHSTFSAAGAEILRLWTGSDDFENSVTIPAGSSKIEPGATPAHPVVLAWKTFSAAADDAGMSRRYGGIHFRSADLAGRRLGRAVAERAWSVANAYFDGSAKITKLRQIQPGDKPLLASVR